MNTFLLIREGTSHRGPSHACLVPPESEFTVGSIIECQGCGRQLKFAPWLRWRRVWFKVNSRFRVKPSKGRGAHDAD